MDDENINMIIEGSESSLKLFKVGTRPKLIRLLVKEEITKYKGKKVLIRCQLKGK